MVRGTRRHAAAASGRCKCVSVLRVLVDDGGLVVVEDVRIDGLVTKNRVRTLAGGVS